jgi:FixJ family two-component response regulator
VLKAGAVGFLCKPFKEQCSINYLNVARKRNKGEGFEQ